MQNLGNVLLTVQVLSVGVDNKHGRYGSKKYTYSKVRYIVFYTKLVEQTIFNTHKIVFIKYLKRTFNKNKYLMQIRKL